MVFYQVAARHGKQKCFLCEFSWELSKVKFSNQEADASLFYNEALAEKVARRLAVRDSATTYEVEVH